MSQRLHIGHTTKEFYDCVIESDEDVETKLLYEWMAYSGPINIAPYKLTIVSRIKLFIKRQKFTGGFIVGPYKIWIADLDLFYRIEPMIKKTFKRVGHKYPDDVWCFFIGDKRIEHPTRKELRKWIKTNEE